MKQTEVDPEEEANVRWVFERARLSHAGPEAYARQIAQMFQCEALHLTDGALTLQAAGEPERIDALHRLLGGYGVLEMVRTGHVLIARGEERTY